MGITLKDKIYIVTFRYLRCVFLYYYSLETSLSDCMCIFV